MSEASQNYVISITIAVMSLYFITYVIYGRTKNRSLIANYKPGALGYKEFRKLIDNPKYLTIAIAAAILSIGYAVFEARAVLQSDVQHSILVVAPIGFVALLLLLSYVIPYLFGKKR